MDGELPLPREIWDRTPPEAQALILLLPQALARIEQLERRVAELESQLEGKGGAGNGGAQQKSKPEPRPHSAISGDRFVHPSQ